MFDLLSSLAWVIQIIMLIMYHTITEFDPAVALLVMEALR